MSFAAALRKMAEAGLTLDQAADIIDALDQAKPRSRGAERQRRYRERHAEQSEGVTSDVTSDASQRDVTGLPSSPETKVSPRPPSKTQPSPTIPTPPLVPPPHLAFDAFWEAYPSKVGKRSARQAFDRAARRTEPAELMAGIERAKASRTWADGFIPNPATWLNQDRWLDELPSISTAPPTRAPARSHDRPNPKRQNWIDSLHDIDRAMAEAVVERQRELGGR